MSFAFVSSAQLLPLGGAVCGDASCLYREVSVCCPLRRRSVAEFGAWFETGPCGSAGLSVFLALFDSP